MTLFLSPKLHKSLVGDASDKSVVAVDKTGDGVGSRDACTVTPAKTRTKMKTRKRKTLNMRLIYVVFMIPNNSSKFW